MGVLACDRRNCENIMCDYVSHEHNSYLCDECRDELIRTGPQNIRAFLDTDKVSSGGSSEDWEKLVLNTFVDRRP